MLEKQDMSLKDQLRSQRGEVRMDLYLQTVWNVAGKD